MPHLKQIRLILAALALIVGFFAGTPARLAAQEPATEGLQKMAHEAYVKGRYTEAEACNLQIANRRLSDKARRYAVLMLGTLYEKHLVNLEKARHWYREYLEGYASRGQVRFYEEKLAFLEKLKPQEAAYATYRQILSSNGDDTTKARAYEDLLAVYPEFLLKSEVLRELGHAHARLENYRKSYLAFSSLLQQIGGELTPSEQLVFDKAQRNWHRTIGAGVAWGVFILLWLAVIAMKPWERISRASLKIFNRWAAAWFLISVVSIIFYAIKVRTAEHNLFHDAAVYVAAVLNLLVLFWVQLLTHGKPWKNRPRALQVLSPALAIVMTTVVCYLFIFHQPNGTTIMDDFSAKYQHWIEEIQGRNQISEQSQGKV